MKFVADKVRINGPRIDGSISVILDVGEYEAENVSKLLTIPQHQSLTITVDTNA